MGFPNAKTLCRGDVVVVCWLRNVPATCWCISGIDMRRQLHVLPHLRQNLQIKVFTSPSHRLLFRDNGRDSWRGGGGTHSVSAETGWPDVSELLLSLFDLQYLSQ